MVGIHMPMHSVQQPARSIMTSGSEEDSLAAAASRKGLYPKSHIAVELDNFYSSKVYTTGSSVSGNVVIITKRDIRFDNLQILLLGNTKTRSDGVNSPQEVSHTFLKLIMPIPESSYPVPRVLETGREYTIPFHFVIPSYLTVNACNHHMSHDQLQDQHVLLPPSMGHWEKSDMSPQMAVAEYSIKARVLRDDEVTRKPSRIFETSRRIHVLPASAEEPPLNVTKRDVLYKMNKSKSVRKNLLSSKLGRITADAIQSSPVYVRPDGRRASGAVAQIDLKFEPASADTQLPKVSSASGKVAAHTFYSSGTIPNFPNLGDWSLQYMAAKHGEYSTSVALAPFEVSKNRWTQHLAPTARRDSGYASDQDECASESDSLNSSIRQSSGSNSNSNNNKTKKLRTRSGSPIFHTTSLSIPIQLPVDKKTFIPTFHSCIVSRVYVLHLTVVVAVGSASTTLNLALPLQVAVEPASPQALGLPSFETAIEEAEAAEADEDFLLPRMIAVPEWRYHETSELPGYVR